MVYARFTPSLSNVTTTPVTQWDYGRKVRIEGLKLPTAVRIDIGISGSGETKSRIGIAKDGVTDVVIPDCFLEQPNDLVAYVYVQDTTEGKTVKTIHIPVIAREEPEEHDTPENKQLFAEAIELINDVADRVEAAENTAKSHADSAAESLGTTQEIAAAFNETAINAVNAVNDAMDLQVQSIETAKANTLKDIQSEGAAQVKAIQDEGASQLKQIQIAGENIVEASAIAEQNAKNVLSNAIKGHLKGEVVTVDDVSPVEHEMNVKVKSKNILPFTVKGSSLNGTTYAIGEDGSLAIDSTPSSGFYLTIGIWKEPIELNGTYTISIGTSLPKGSYFWLKDAEGNYQHLITYYSAGNTEKTLELDGVYREFGIWISVDGTFSNHVFYPMLEEGTTPTEYTPYIDPSTVKVRRCGKNLFDITNFIGKANTVNGVTAQVKEDGCVHVSGSPIDTSVSTTIDLSHSKDAPKFPKGTYIYSNNAIRANENILCFPQANNSITGSWLANFLPTGGEISAEFSIRHVVVFIKQGVVGDVSSKFCLQVETGNNATEFEPFKDISTCTPTSDGTVSGMMSTAPNMTILTDTEGVVIDCEYNVDTKTYIDKKFDELKSMINV